MLGRRMRRLRLARGMTQKELADPKYSYAYVSTIEAGRRTPSRKPSSISRSGWACHPDELLTGRPADLEARLELRLQEAIVAMSGRRDGRVVAGVPVDREGSEAIRSPPDPGEGREVPWACGASVIREPEEGLAHHQTRRGPARATNRRSSGSTPSPARRGASRRSVTSGMRSSCSRASSTDSSASSSATRMRSPGSTPRSCSRTSRPALLRKAAESGEELLALGPHLHGPRARRPDAHERRTALPRGGPRRGRAALAPSCG